MAKARTVFTCQTCGHQSPKLMGRCPECKSWNSYVEETYEDPASRDDPRRRRRISGGDERPRPITELDADAEPRLLSGIAEFDRVAGGGLVPGSVLLVGGAPGVGKSTLILQILSRLAASGQDVLYVSGEESARQVKLRADRLGALEKRLFVAAQTDLERIEKMASEARPAVLAVDSIQTVYNGDMQSAPGSVGQVRESAARIIGLAKRSGLAALLVGHVTKEGSLAGPRVLEHMVDAVLTFEGDGGHSYRILRATKNRFGSTNEVGVFEMRREGLTEVNNPSQLFLAERPLDAPGSVVTVSVEGTRPLLVEVQALVSPTSFGTPRRTCIGVDPNRVALLAAVLEKKAGFDMVGLDIFVNVAGGVRLTEPAIDLGVAVALVSSFIDKPVPTDTLVTGEIGLTGEVRSVGQPELRLTEARKMGFTRVLMPCMRGLKTPDDMRVEMVNGLSDAIDRLF